MNKIKTGIVAVLTALTLAGTARAVTLETGLTGNFQKVRPLVGVSQELLKAGKVKVSGRVEKEFGKPLALQAWGSYDLGRAVERNPFGF